MLSFSPVEKFINIGIVKVCFLNKKLNLPSEKENKQKRGKYWICPFLVYILFLFIFCALFQAASDA